MDDKIFRKVSVERLSSPENLDQVIRVVPARNWIALACLFAFAASVVAWAFLGEIARQVQGSGMLLLGGSGAPQEAVAVFSAEDGGAIRVGMEAFVAISIQKNAALAGRVAAVLPADVEIAADGESIPVGILTSLAAKPGDVLALVRFDAEEAARVEKILTEGESCRVDVTVERFHPVRLVLPD